ncbi:MAG: Uncharacterized protein G01um101444_442 [Parcubacteria group bacterium Gr01-1014_44]|nr:MAG: Uncharacterized protein G01um101444_442 [Parcubacteria group bacterium Gr01-1014_44]
MLPTAKQFRFLPQIISKKEHWLLLTLSAVILGSLIFIPFGIFYHFTIAAPDFGGSYTEGLIGTPQFINPLLVQANDTDRDLASIFYAGLLKYDSQGDLVPDLAESYQISDNGLEYSFTLKKNIKWHDGYPLTADDVVFTVKILQNNDYGSIQRINWQGIETEKINDRVVKIKLKNKYAQFLSNTTLGILPKHLWENVKPALFALSELNLNPIGSGPYKLKRIGKDSQSIARSYELTAFEDYHDGRPFIKNVSFRFYDSEDQLISAYNNNSIQGLGVISPEKLKNIKFSQRLNIRQIKLPRYFAAFFNQNQSKLLSDKNIRLALNYGTNKTNLVEEVLKGNGLAINSPLLKELNENNPPAGGLQKFAFDKEFAKQILENSNWKDTDGNGLREKDKTELVLKVTTSNFPELIKAADLLKKQWKELGFKIEIKVETLAEIQFAIQNRSFEILLFGEVQGLNFDPFSFWHSLHKKDPGLNLALYDNKSADKIMEEGRQILDTISRNNKYNDFEKILLEDAPAVFLYSPHYLYLPASKIKDNDLSVLSLPSDRFDNISQWSIETKRVRPLTPIP